MERSYLVSYVVPFVSVFVLAASIGGAVLGAYIPVQQSFGLCGQPEMSVFTPQNAPGLTDGDGFQEVQYSDLSEEARTAFEEAIESPNDVAEIEGSLAPDERDAFQTGVVVLYEGTRYYMTITAHECVSTTPLPAGGVSPLVLSLLGVVGIVLGGVGLSAPVLWRLRSGRTIESEGQGSIVVRTARSALAPFRDGEYQGAALLGSFGAGTLLSLVPVIGPLLGGSIIGATAPTVRRAGLLGAYAGAVVTVVLGLNAVFTVLPGALDIIPRSVIVLVPGLAAVDPTLITGIVAVVPVILAPVSAAITRVATRSF